MACEGPAGRTAGFPARAGLTHNSPRENMSSSVGGYDIANIWKIIKMFQTTSSEIFVEIRIFVLIKTSVGLMQQHVPLCQVRNSLFEPGH